jgi:ATP-binding cassette subfamily C (CFTR/MRP) protein 1
VGAHVLASQGDTSEDTGKTLLEAWKRQLKARPDDPSLFRAVMDVYLKMFVQSGVWKFINDMVVFIGPLLLQSLIAFVEQGGQPGAEERSVVDGALLAVGIFVAKTVESFALAMYFHMGYRIGGRLRNAAAMIVYRKSFLLSSKGRQTYKVGEMVSLMSVDATRLCNSAPYLHLFWSTPLQLSVGTTLLYNLLGPSVFAGVAPHPYICFGANSNASVRVVDCRLPLPHTQHRTGCF